MNKKEVQKIIYKMDYDHINRIKIVYENKKNLFTESEDLNSLYKISKKEIDKNKGFYGYFSNFEKAKKTRNSYLIKEIERAKKIIKNS